MPKRKRRRLKKTVRKALIAILSVVVLAAVAGTAILIHSSMNHKDSTGHTANQIKEDDASNISNTDQTKDATVSKSSQDAQSVRITATGDILLEEPILNYFGSGDWKDHVDDLKPYFENDDLTIANQEVPIGGEELGIEGINYQFNSPNATAKNLKDSGIDFVSLANNHSLDRGLEGIVNTHKNLDEAGVGYTGTYTEEGKQDELNIQTINGMRIAIISTTYGCNKPIDLPWAVNAYGAAWDDRSDKVIADIQKARTQADAVIVCIHWGTEFTYDVNEDQKLMAQAMADAGADVIIGNHPHCIQPAQWLTTEDGREVLCFYSLGNLIASAYAVDRATEQFQNMYEVGAIAQFTLKKADGKLSIDSPEIIPVVNHFEGDYSSYKLMPLKDYSEELALRHDQHSFSEQFGWQYLKDQVHSVFDPSGIPLVLD